MTINPKILAGIEDKRKIDAEILDRLEVSTGKTKLVELPNGDTRTDVVPDIDGNVLIFPLKENGHTVGEKYIAPKKRFWQKAGGKRTFINADVLDDPAVAAGEADVTITEGEWDMLSALTCGFPFTMSVPDGAPPVPEGKEPEELEEWRPEDDTEGKFRFLYNCRDKMKRVRRFILAVDNDGPGKRLAAELVRRLGAARCSFVTYPGDRKDLNDVHRDLGPEAVAKCLNEAQPYPVRGLYKLFDYPELEEPDTYSTGWGELDLYFKFYRSEFVVVSGIPNMGKSTFVVSLAAQLADLHNFNIGIASFEGSPVPHVRNMLRHYKLGPHRGNRESQAEADDWINRRFCWIDYDPRYDEEDIDVDWLLEKAEDAVHRHGIDCLIVDPWNEMDHFRKPGESETEYTGRAIKKLKRFAKSFNVCVLVVVHPVKQARNKDGKIDPPSPYDAAGSAHWFNKSDHFLTVHRQSDDKTNVDVMVQKCRFAFAGKKGKVELSWSAMAGRYEEIIDPEGSVLI